MLPARCLSETSRYADDPVGTHDGLRSGDEGYNAIWCHRGHINRHFHGSVRSGYPQGGRWWYCKHT